MLERSRLGSFFSGLFVLGFAAVCYYAILKQYLPEYTVYESVVLAVEKDKLILIFLGAGLLMFGQIYTSFRNAIYGEKYEFLSLRSKVFRNGKFYLNFDTIKNIQIREFHDSDGDNTYRLSLVLNDGSKKFLESSTSEHDIQSIAGDIADLLGVHLINK